MCRETKTEPALPAGAVETPVPSSSFGHAVARRTLMEHFGVVSLEAFGCEHLPLATAAAGAIVEYLAETQQGAVKDLKGLTAYSTAAFMTLDPQTRRNLEIFEGGKVGRPEPLAAQLFGCDPHGHGGEAIASLDEPAAVGPAPTGAQAGRSWLVSR